MLVLDDFKQFRIREDKPLVLAVGNFDGLHLGHQALLRKVKASAQSHGGHSAVLTFTQHPQHVLHPTAKPPLLTCPVHKLFLLYRMGIEYCWMLPFTAQFAKMEPEFFVEEILVKTLNVREVYLGFNARFGRERRGDAVLMKQLAAKHGFYFEAIEPVYAGDEMVSSSRIRHLIREGELEKAAQCLGRYFSVFGDVMRGDGRGKKIGFPTANLNVTSEILPPLGVYPVRVREIETQKSASDGAEKFEASPGEWRDGILNYGYRPTFKEGESEPLLEAFLFDFDGDLYGRRLEVVFYPRLRGEQQFDGAEALKSQIAVDIEQGKRVLAGMPKPNPIKG